MQNAIVATYVSLDSATPVNVVKSVDNPADSSFVNAGTYTVNGAITDENYVAINPSYTVTIHPLVVDETNSTVTWWYADADNDLVEITDKDFAIDYKGAQYVLYVKYSVQNGDNGAGVTDGFRTESAVAASAILNAGDYVVTPDHEADNYDLSSLSHKFTVKPLVREVTWDQENVEFTYNAKLQTVTANCSGVGAEASESIIDIADNEFRNANVGESKYTAVVSVKGEYASNYVLKDADKDGNVTREWSIAPIVIDVTWNVDNLVYNDGYVLNDWSASVSNQQTDEQGVEDNVTMTYVIRDANGTEAKEGFTLAGNYTVEIASVSDTNYSIKGVQPKAVTVKRATPNVTNVTYVEYAESAVKSYPVDVPAAGENVTYLNNVKGLRNDRLVFESTSPVSGNPVNGALTFDEGADLSNLGRRSFNLTFTPEDTNNFETVDLSIFITVLEDTVSRVGFNANRRQLNYSVGLELDPSPIVIYFEYASYYEETVEGVTTPYGYRSGAIDKSNPANNVRFYLTSEDADVRISNTYTFKESDVGSRDLVVYVRDGDSEYSGTISVEIVKSLPTKLTVENKAELEAGEYFVGNTFDKTKAVFFVKYDEAEADGIIDAASITMENGELTAPADQHTVTFIYKVGSREVKDTVTITVKPKIVVSVRFVDATYRWTESGVELVITTADGEALPEGIEYKFYNVSDGSPAYLTMGEGEVEKVFDLEARFTVDTSRYAPIDPVTATITLRVIVADVDDNELRGPWARDAEPLSTTTKAYSGTAFAPEDYALRNIKIVDNSEGSDAVYTTTVDYFINNKPANSVEILEAGTYTIKAVINVASNDGTTFKLDRVYTIVITKAQNVITNLSVANWISGEQASEPVCIRSFGTPEYLYEGVNGTDYHSSIKPTEPGNYKVIATIFGTDSYTETEATANFTIMQPQIVAEGSNGQPLTGDDGKNVVSLTGSDGKGVTPGYELKIELIDDESALQDIKAKDSQFKKQIVMNGYDLKVVDANGQEVQDPGKYTVKILLSAEQRNAKDLKLYSVDEYGQATELKISAVDKDGYISAEISNFNNKFVLSAKDVEAARKTGWTLGLAIGGAVVLILVIVLIVVIIKKKREND